jgi:acetylglutamate synthase
VKSNAFNTCLTITNFIRIIFISSSSLPRLKTNREETRIFNDEAWNEFAGRNLNSRKQDATKTHVERPMTAMSGAGYRKNGNGSY